MSICWESTQFPADSHARGCEERCRLPSPVFLLMHKSAYISIPYR